MEMLGFLTINLYFSIINRSLSKKKIILLHVITWGAYNSSVSVTLAVDTPYHITILKNNNSLIASTILHNIYS